MPAQPGELLEHQSAIQVWGHGRFRSKMWSGLAVAVRRSPAVQPRNGLVVAPVGERVHPVGAERPVAGGLGERLGMGGGSRILGGKAAVARPHNMLIELF